MKNHVSNHIFFTFSDVMKSRNPAITGKIPKTNCIAPLLLDASPKAETVVRQSNMIKQTICTLFSIFTILAVPAVWADTPPTVIEINPGKTAGKVNPMIFGNNLESANGKGIFGDRDTNDPINGQGAWNPALGRPVPEVVEIAQTIKLGMLRYPGGCLTHNFDWHQAVGPKNERSYYKFGIDEYIELCRAIGAEPLMNVSEICSPKDAADLVEYLNMPASAQYPWAMKRAMWGHPEPYKVRYFEMANESDHGNHNVKPELHRTASEYASWYLDCAAAMRAKDQNISIGGHAGTGTPVNDPWNATVLKLAGNAMDFFAVHTYVVGGSPEDPREAMQACMAVTDQVVAKLADYRKLVRQQTGKDIPLAITEFNAGFIQEKPLPYRFTFGAALFCADYMREMLKPETNVAFANYWQFLNGYWGYVRTKTNGSETKVKTLAAYPVFVLMGRHTGKTLIDCQVSNEPKIEFRGCNTVTSAKINFQPQEKYVRNLELQLSDVQKPDYTIEITGNDSFVVKFDHINNEAYWNFPSFAVNPDMAYQVKCEVKITTQTGSATPGIGLADARGWSETKSASGSHSSNANSDWTSLQCTLTPLSTAQKFNVVLRLTNGKNFTGTAEFKNIKVAEVVPRTFPPYSAVTALASIGDDAKTIELIVLNKDLDNALPVRIKLPGIISARLWTVTAPDLAVTKHAPDGAWETVSGQNINDITGSGISLTIPARSINALEITLK